MRNPSLLPSARFQADTSHATPDRQRLSTVLSDRARLGRVYLIEALAAVAANLLTLGIFFFTSVRFGWSLQQNLMLSAAMGLLYTVGALSAHPLTKRFGRVAPLALCFIGMAVATFVAALFTTPLVVTVVLLIDITLGTVCWPILENLICAGDVPPHELSRRLSIYNLVWASISAAVVAVNGLIIEQFGAGVFVLAGAACAVGAWIALFHRIEPYEHHDADAHRLESPCAHPIAEPEPQLLRQRVTALWLSRICMPAMYVATFALAAMMPALSLVQSYRPAVQTVLCSVWLAVRWVAFVALGATSFWHTRPRLLPGAAAALLVAFVLITVRLSEMLPGLPVGAGAIDLAGLIFGQVLLGITTGLIYMASLYFGMVLTEGSARSGGYHEAMIGIGMMLGPATALGTQTLWPGQQRAAAVAVAGLIMIGIILTNLGGLHLRRRHG